MAIKKFSVVFYCQFLNYCISIWKWNKKKRNVMFSEVSEWWILEEPQYKNGWNNWLQTLHTFLTDCFTTEYPYFLLQNFHQFWRRIFRKTIKKQIAQENIWKEENRGHLFVCLLVHDISVKKNHWKLQFCIFFLLRS